PANVGYQNIQSAAAIANGGLVGTGVGQGRAKYGYLPEADTDFIFSVIGEELGFLGAMVLLVLFLALGAAAIRVAMRAPDRFGMLVASGIAAWFLFQAVVNIGAAVGVMPTTGVPLPFVSAGGSSLLISLFAAGILCNIARHTS
ncbi:MAG: FtsW/RodA/SpoVE family cell cycle protein, partial [Acidimicrobiales bacterium]|nr:FtsW/RodA/SpoVE family cell cycle protein [Acidimicrobiales bacterium]